MDRNLLIKQLIYQSNHRGCKETDYILGDFAKKHCEKMTDFELNLYSKLLNEDDWEIYRLVTSGEIKNTKYNIFNL